MEASDQNFRRMIDQNDAENYQRYLREIYKKDPRLSHHYQFDDDYVFDHSCRRNSWWNLYNPNCNSFHEIELPRRFDKDALLLTEDQSFNSYLIR